MPGTSNALTTVSIVTGRLYVNTASSRSISAGIFSKEASTCSTGSAGPSDDISKNAVIRFCGMRPKISMSSAIPCFATLSPMMSTLR